MAIPKVNLENEKPSSPTNTPAESSTSALEPTVVTTTPTTKVAEVSKQVSNSKASATQATPAVATTLWQPPLPGTILVEKPPAHLPFNPHPDNPSPPATNPHAWSSKFNLSTMAKPAKPFYEPHLDREKLQEVMDLEMDKSNKDLAGQSLDVEKEMKEKEKADEKIRDDMKFVKGLEERIKMMDKLIKEKEEALAAERERERIWMEGTNSEEGDDEADGGEEDEEGDEGNDEESSERGSGGESKNKMAKLDLKQENLPKNVGMSIRLKEWLERVELEREKVSDDTLGAAPEKESLESGNPYEDKPLSVIAEELPGETDE
ncbi:hypothetical protein VTL71DRAFT_5585 [Oculimacula yallundae]|uniref:Uncharacterized protein n=1 Tax=Oculimacula yallundae TaxID=86028 RepID=A0ABR4C1J5_9HELO